MEGGEKVVCCVAFFGGRVGVVWVRGCARL